MDALAINLNLVKAPQNVLDYIITHELCHKKIPNHSNKFWNLLLQVMPNYPHYKKWLDLNGKVIF
jgi:predicted metal-dependent hydrolase